MMRRKMLLVLLAGLTLSGCGGENGTVVEKAPAVEMQQAPEEQNAMKNVNIPVNGELLEPMKISDGIDRNRIVERAKEKIRDGGLILGFPENGGLPDPASCVAGVKVKEHAPFVYIYRLAEGEANYDETEMLSSVLAYLSIVEDSGFRVDTVESATYIYDGFTEVAHFVIAGTQDAGYLMYLQIQV